jgi:hypothetical protein
MTEMVLPQFGMGMADGTITVWHKAEGDHIEQGEPLCDVEAAKTTVEVAAPCGGILQRIIVGAGQNVPVNTVIALIGNTMLDPDNEGLIAPDIEPSVTDAPEPMAPTAETVVPSAAPIVVPTSLIPNTNLANGTQQIEPRARRAAKLHGVDLALVSGTGPGGRIIERDVLDTFNATNAASAVAAPFTSQIVPALVPPSTAASMTMYQLHMRCEAKPLTSLLSQLPLYQGLTMPVTAALLRAVALAAAKGPFILGGIGLRSDGGDIQTVFNPAGLSLLGIISELEEGTQTKMPAPSLIIDWHSSKGLDQIVSMDTSVPACLSVSTLENGNGQAGDQWGIVLTINKAGPLLAEAKQLLLSLRQLLMQPLSILA